MTKPPLQPPPDRDKLLGVFERTTPAAYHEPWLRDPGGAIAQFRGPAQALAVLARQTARKISRQLLTAPPGLESAGPLRTATMTIVAERSGDLDQALHVAAGALVMDAARGRSYRTIHDVTWWPFDPEPVKSINLACVIPGEYGNLEHVADDAGLITDPDGGPGLSWIDLADQSQQRSGTGARLVIGSPTTLADPGAPATFSPADVGLYLRINSASNPANVGRRLRITGWSIADTPVNGYATRTITLDDGPQPELVAVAQLDDGGVFSDQTAGARSQAIDDLELLPAAPAIGDAVYFGSDVPPASLVIDVTTRRFGDLSVAWEYWDGGSWVALPDIVDGTEAFAVTGRSDVTWSAAPGWTPVAVGLYPKPYFYLRARVVAFVSQTQQPLGAIAIAFVAEPLAVEPSPGEIGWTILDWRDLGLRILEIKAATGGRDDDLGLRLRERGVIPYAGESIEDLRVRASRFADVVSPEQLTWQINRVLNPVGLAGQVCDLANGFKGLFWDVPADLAPAMVGAWDLYEPGDTFPLEKTFLPLSEAEAKWTAFVKLPRSGLGEFGAAWDEGPPAYYSDFFGTFLGSAWDFAFTDGYPWTAAKLYQAVIDRVNDHKGGGIKIVVIPGDVHACP